MPKHFDRTKPLPPGDEKEFAKIAKPPAEQQDFPPPSTALGDVKRAPEEGPPPDNQDFPPPSEIVREPLNADTRPVPAQKFRPSAKEQPAAEETRVEEFVHLAPEPVAAVEPDTRPAQAPEFPAGAPDTGPDRDPKPYPSEVHSVANQNFPPPSAQYPDLAEQRSEEMKHLPAPGPAYYVPGHPEPDTWVPPKDRPVPKRQMTGEHIRAVVSLIRDIEDTASAAPHDIEHLLVELDDVADQLDDGLPAAQIAGRRDQPCSA